MKWVRFPSVIVLASLLGACDLDSAATNLEQNDWERRSAAVHLNAPLQAIDDEQYDHLLAEITFPPSGGASGQIVLFARHSEEILIIRIVDGGRDNGSFFGTGEGGTTNGTSPDDDGFFVHTYTFGFELSDDTGEEGILVLRSETGPGPLLQTIKFHTSCSAPLIRGQSATRAC